MKIASIDVGLKRIGVAISMDGKIVFPQKAILRQNRKQAARDVKVLLLEWQIEQLIVGVPKGGSAEEEMERRIKHFVGLLELEEIVVIYQDEQGSSVEAKELAQGVFRQKRDGRIDSLAAKIILERWLEQQ